MSQMSTLLAWNCLCWARAKEPHSVQLCVHTEQSCFGFLAGHGCDAFANLFVTPTLTLNLNTSAYRPHALQVLEALPPATPCPPNKLQLALITVCNRQLGVAGSTLLWGCLGANKQEKASDGLELGARGAGWGCGVWGLRGAGAGKPFGACAVKF